MRITFVEKGKFPGLLSKDRPRSHSLGLDRPSPTFAIQFQTRRDFDLKPKNSAALKLVLDNLTSS